MNILTLCKWSAIAVSLGLLIVSPTWAKKGENWKGTNVQETVVIQEGVSVGKTPPGRVKGKKKGWEKHNAVMPPGQQKNLIEKGKYPKGLQKPK
jgi:hypothetical protein